VWLLVVAAYLYPFPYFQRLNNPNENVRIWMTRAIVEHGTLDITAVTRDWGFVDDKAAFDGHLYSSKAPGVSFAGVPVLYGLTRILHLVAKASPSQLVTTLALRLSVVIVPVAAFLWFFARFVERASGGSPVARDLLVLGLGLGSPMYPYGLLFVGHSLGAALAFAAYAVLDVSGSTGPLGSERSPRHYVLSGLLAGLAIVFEYQLILVAVILGLSTGLSTAGQRFRQSLLFLAGTLPSFVALGIYHWVLFGKPWAFPYGHLENPGFATLHHGTGWFGLGVPSLAALVSLCISPRVGLFAFSPFLVFGIWAAAHTARKGLAYEGLVPLAVVASLLLFQAGMSNWRGGWSVGPRYIVAAAPFLAAAIARSWPQPSPPGWITMFAALVGASVFLCGLSGAMFPHYPEAYGNPVFDLTVPLLRHGFAPYSLGYVAGLSGAASLLPLVAIALAAWTATLLRVLPARQVAGAAIVCCVWLAAFSRFDRITGLEQDASTAGVQALWEPMPAARQLDRRR
jgi:hypothetical protein